MVWRIGGGGGGGVYILILFCANISTFFPYFDHSAVPTSHYSLVLFVGIGVLSDGAGCVRASVHTYIHACVCGTYHSQCMCK